MGAEQEIADLNSLVAGLYNQGKYRPALEIAKHAYEMAAQALGENHPLTLSSVNNAAALFKATHDYEKAEQLYLKALKIVANLYGEPHPESVFFLHNLARCYHAAGRYSEMEQILRQALDIAKQFIFEINPDHIIQCLNTLADVEAILGRYMESEKHLEEALNLAGDVFGEGSIAYAQTLQNLSSLYIGLNRDIDAEPLLQKVLAIIGSAPGPCTLWPRCALIWETVRTPRRCLSDRLPSNAPCLEKTIRTLRSP
jgi:tetratricopeptide (TPR) repeat protein